MSEGQRHPELGVIYDRADYAGFMTRILMDMIDLVVVLAVSISVTTMAYLLFPHSDAGLITLIPLGVLTFLYFTIIKSSRLRTIGFRLLGYKVVNLKGERPSLFAMIARFAWVCMGPLNLVIDIFWIPSDRNRQALRDKWARTYVVKNSARPAASGPIVMRRWSIMSMNFLFEEVKVLKSREAAS